MQGVRAHTFFFRKLYDSHMDLLLFYLYFLIDSLNIIYYAFFSFIYRLVITNFFLPSA